MPFRAFFMALGMFSIFPARNSWRQECAPWVIPMLPLVGLVIGLGWCAAALAAVALPIALRTAAVALTPFVFSGFLHADGFMDAADAVMSRRPLEERRRILKDPGTGAFAVAATICLFMLQFCAAHSVITGEKGLAALALIPVISRCAVGYALLTLRPMARIGLLYTFKEGAKPKHFAAILAMTAIFFMLGFAVDITGGLGFPRVFVTLAAAYVSARLCALWLCKQLDGFSGDLCGCSLVTGELCGLLAFACL